MRDNARLHYRLSATKGAEAVSPTVYQIDRCVAQRMKPIEFQSTSFFEESGLHEGSEIVQLRAGDHTSKGTL